MQYLTEPFDYQVLNLTNQFFIDYPNPPYKEIMRKNNRPYNCLLIQSHYGYFICIPYRSNIHHKFSFLFKNSRRSQQKKSGLDYSKMVIIKNPNYISSKDAIIDQDEYNETRRHIKHIKNDAQKYIENYIHHLTTSPSKSDFKKFSRTYQYSTLQYFHKELGIA